MSFNLGEFGNGPSGRAFRDSGGNLGRGVAYPSPFFDLSHTWLPNSVKKLLQWCRYYYLTNGTINTVVHKMAEYPITEIVVHESNKGVKEKWEELLGSHLRYRAFQIEAGLDFFTYGIVVVTIHFPFTKYLVCKKCKKKVKAKDAKYRWRNLDYFLECAGCGDSGPATVEDQYEKDYRRIRLLRWNPENLFIDPGFAGAEPVYTFEVPQQVRSDVQMGKRAVVDTIPDVYVESMKRGKNIAFSRDNLFVMRRPIASTRETGWGMPLILPVLKDAFHLQVLRKSQEAVVSEHIVPLRILFPQVGSGSADPYSSVPLAAWRDRIEQEIAKFRVDQNYIPVLPMPVGQQSVGGEGKALSLYQEIQIVSEQLVQGMGVPLEFIKGGMSFTGSNVSLRMIENMFMGYRIDHERMLNDFVVRRIAGFMGWPAVKATMKKFRMADDLQRMGFKFQLNQGQKISDETLIRECDEDPVVENERKEREVAHQLEYQRKTQIAQAEIQAQVQGIQLKAQNDLQKQFAADPPPGPPPAPGGMEPAPAAGEPPQPGQQPSGREGEMIPGDQTGVPGVPPEVSISPENAQQPPQEGANTALGQSPLSMQTQGGGYNLLYIAQRVWNFISQLDQTAQGVALSKLSTSNPQLYALVIQLKMREIGSQKNPYDPVQSPMPQQKPSRRAAGL